MSDSIDTLRADLARVEAERDVLLAVIEHEANAAGISATMPPAGRVKALRAMVQARTFQRDAMARVVEAARAVTLDSSNCGQIVKWPAIALVIALRDALLAHDSRGGGDGKYVPKVGDVTLHESGSQFIHDGHGKTHIITNPTGDWYAADVPRHTFQRPATPAELLAHGLAGEAKGGEPKGPLLCAYCAFMLPAGTPFETMYVHYETAHKYAMDKMREALAAHASHAPSPSKPAFKVGDRVQVKGTDTVLVLRYQMSDKAYPAEARGRWACARSVGVEPHALYDASEIEPVEPSKPAGERPRRVRVLSLSDPAYEHIITKGREYVVNRWSNQEPSNPVVTGNEGGEFALIPGEWEPAPSPRAEVEIPEGVERLADKFDKAPDQFSPDQYDAMLDELFKDAPPLTERGWCDEPSHRDLALVILAVRRYAHRRVRTALAAARGAR